MMLKRIFKKTRVLRFLFLQIIIFLFISNCATTDIHSLNAFREGLLVFDSESRILFAEFNRIVRALQLDRAAGLSNISESDFTPGIAPQALRNWNMAVQTLTLYASSLEILASPSASVQVEKSLKTLGERIAALKEQNAGTESGHNGFSHAISRIGMHVIHGSARTKALEIARNANPDVREILFYMSDMIGGPDSGGLRMIMWSNQTTYADQYRAAFLEKNADKRDIASRYVTALERRESIDMALDALGKTLIALADLHTAASQGRHADSRAIIAGLRHEISHTRKWLIK